jgi:hypothetical protein
MRLGCAAPEFLQVCKRVVQVATGGIFCKAADFNGFLVNFLKHAAGGTTSDFPSARLKRALSAGLTSSNVLIGAALPTPADVHPA